MANINKIINDISSTTQGVYDTGSRAVLLTLSKAYIGLSAFRPATTAESGSAIPTPALLSKKLVAAGNGTFAEATTSSIDRYDYDRLWSLQLGEYFMPVSQLFTLRAKKNLNISSLVDGIDIIQQTRKEAKMIDCSLRISLRDGEDVQRNLKILRDEQVQELSVVLQDLYESDAIFEINNDYINNTFGVTDVFMTEYKFNPRIGGGTYNIDFSLQEIIYGDNVLTFDSRQITD